MIVSVTMSVRLSVCVCEAIFADDSQDVFTKLRSIKKNTVDIYRLKLSLVNQSWKNRKKSKEATSS